MRRCRFSQAAAGVGLFLALSAGTFADTGVDDLRVDQQFQVRAVVTTGCQLSTGQSASYGVINFGQVTSLPAAVTKVSTVGNGSIVLQCTPGTVVTIGIGTGSGTATVTSGRYMLKGSERLRYQLYKNSGFTDIWGDGSNGATAMSVTFPASGGVLTYPIYAQLFSVTPMPSAGVYNDLVTVTVSY